VTLSLSTKEEVALDHQDQVDIIVDIGVTTTDPSEVAVVIESTPAVKSTKSLVNTTVKVNAEVFPTRVIILNIQND
jgi:hypothetical protein